MNLLKKKSLPVSSEVQFLGLTGKQTKLVEDPFTTTKLEKMLNSRKNEIKEIQIRCCPELKKFGDDLAKKLPKAKCV